MAGRAFFTFFYDFYLLDNYGKKAVNTICTIEKARVNSERASNINVFKTELVRYIPKYITPSAAGYSAPLDGDDFKMILVDENVPDGADFAVKIQGNSMLPYIQDGDTAYVKKGCELSIGDIGIFSVDGAIYCKQYYIDENKNLTLISTNPNFKNTNIHIDHENESLVRCFGKVLLKSKAKLPSYFLLNQ